MPSTPPRPTIPINTVSGLRSATADVLARYGDALSPSIRRIIDAAEAQGKELKQAAALCRIHEDTLQQSSARERAKQRQIAIGNRAAQRCGVLSRADLRSISGEQLQKAENDEIHRVHLHGRRTADLHNNDLYEEAWEASLNKVIEVEAEKLRVDAVKMFKKWGGMSNVASDHADGQRQAYIESGLAEVVNLFRGPGPGKKRIYKQLLDAFAAAVAAEEGKEGFERPKELEGLRKDSLAYKAWARSLYHEVASKAVLKEVKKTPRYYRLPGKSTEDSSVV